MESFRVPGLEYSQTVQYTGKEEDGGLSGLEERSVGVIYQAFQSNDPELTRKTVTYSPLSITYLNFEGPEFFFSPNYRE